ncbi:MAG: response regulator [Bacteroidota bacterium]
MKEVTILLADDHRLIREGLRTIIEKNPSFRVIAEATEGREAIKLCTNLKPQVVLMDVSMPGLNGIEATRKIKNENAETRVIALSMYTDKQFVTGMLKAGASGYLQKDVESSELITAIKTVIAGQQYICHEVSNLIIDEFLQDDNIHDKPELSGREREILQMIAEGNSSKEIAEKLFLSRKTVDVHRKNIMDKLELYTLPELTKYAIRSGLTTLDS